MNLKKATLTVAAASILTGGALVYQDIQLDAQVNKLPPDQRLKAPVSRVLDSITITQTETSATGTPSANKHVVRYAYITTEAPKEKDEKVDKRTPTAQFFTSSDGNEVGRFYTAPQFYKDDSGKWYNVERAVTTPEAFDLQTSSPVSLIRKAFAQTTAPYYAVAGDGRVHYSSVVSYANARASSVGLSVDYTGTNLQPQSELVGGAYNIRHNFLPMDTAAIPDDATVSSSTLYLYYNSVGCDDTSSTNAGDPWVVSANQAATTSLVNDDFDLVGTVKFSSEKIDFTTVAAGGARYYSMTLNSTGLSYISPTTTTKLGLRSDNDFSDATAPTGRSYCFFEASESAGTSKDPYIDVVYTAAGGTPTANPYNTVIFE